MREPSYFLHRDALVSLREQLTTTDGHGSGTSLLAGQLDALDEAIGLAGHRRGRLMPTLFDLVPLAVGVVDDAGRLLDANDAAGRLLGYDRAELVGSSTVDLLGRPDHVALDAGNASMPGKAQQRVLTHADRHPLVCEIHTAPSVQHDGTRLWLVVAHDITPHQRRIEQLQHQATHDELTGLLNRQGLHTALDETTAHTPPTGFAVLFCDIDNFKRVNDSWGHTAGDELLTAVARLLRNALPAGCHLARFSGDEFLITCPDVDTEGGLEIVADRVATVLRTSLPVAGRLVRISGSVGAAAIDGAAATVEDLIRFADAAMFEAKQRGPGRTAVADTSLIASADEQLDLEGQLRQALAGEGLSLHYQPIVNSEGTVLAAEALLRWPHPTRGLLGPDVVLPVATQGDLLGQLDRWVVHTALTEASTWPTGEHGSVDIAVNLSGLPGGTDHLLADVATVITETGIEPSQVILELTETALLELPPRQHRAMAELAARGVRFAIDDFGTGYSSLARLQDLPAQIVKLDRTFLPTTDGDTTAAAIAQAVVDLCRATGHNCIAEGVETPAQLQLLEHLGIDGYQGWLFSPALPAPEFRHTLHTGHPATE